MKIEKITYQQTFPTGNFMNQKLGMEVSIDDTDVFESDRAVEAFKYAKAVVEKTFSELNSHVGEVHVQTDWKPETKLYMEAMGDNPKDFPYFDGVINKDPKEKRIDAFIDVINSYNNKEGLIKNMMKLVDKENIPRLTEAFNKKLEEFV